MLVHNYRFDFFHQGLSGKDKTFRGWLGWKILTIRKIQKLLLLMIHLDYRTHNSSKNRLNSFPSRSQPRTLNLWWAIRLRTTDFAPCSRILIVRQFQKCFYYWFISIIELIFRSNYSTDFYHQGHNGRNTNVKEDLTEKTFLSWFRSPIVESELSSLILQQKNRQFSSVTTGLTFSKFSRHNFLIIEEKCIWKSLILLFALELK